MTTTPTEEPRTSWLGHAGGLTWTWVSTLVAVVSLFFVVGLVVGVVCGFVAFDGWTLRVTVATLVTVGYTVLSVGVGVQKAIAAVAVGATRRMGLAQFLVQKVFERLVRSAEFQSRVSVVHELPLAEAEAALRQAISKLDPELPSRGRLKRWILRTVHGRLVRLIEQCTLGEFRKTVGTDGKVDLDLARQYVAGEIDRFIDDKLVGTASAAVRRALIVLSLMAIGLSYVVGRAPQWLPKWGSTPSATTQPAAVPATFPATLPAVEE